MRRGAWLAAAAATGVALLLLAAPVGLLWAALAPRAQVVIDPTGADFANPESNVFFAADGYFLLLTLGVGVICAVVAFSLRRLPPLSALAGLTAGGIGASVIAGHVGARVHRSAFLAALSRAPLGAHLQASVVVRADGVYLGWAFAAVVVYGLLWWVLRRDEPATGYAGPGYGPAPAGVSGWGMYGGPPPGQTPAETDPSGPDRGA